MSRVFSTPEEVEAAFYTAIEQADMKALDDIWSSHDNIVCVHPGTSRIEGRRAVMDSFVELFEDAPVLSFSIVDALCTGNDNLAVHLVREEIELDGQVVSVMVSTNVYHLEGGGWRMLLHHASPEPDLAFEALYDELRAGDDMTLEEFDDDFDEPGQPDRPPVLH